jgi:PAS domain S-box-containing protein
MERVPHDEVIPQLAEHLRPIFESSPDGVYVWLDETHWTCNERFAALFGYGVDEVENRPHFLQAFVHADDQEVFAWNYGNRIDARAFPVTFRFRGVRKDGTEVQAETDMIPLTFGGHTVAYHFVRVCR